jgi:hypothetical protein
MAGRYGNPIFRAGIPDYIGWLESIPGLLERLQIRAQDIKFMDMNPVLLSL